MTLRYASEDLKQKFSGERSLGFARQGEALFLENRTQDALRILTEGVARHPHYLTGFLVLGRIYQKTGRTAEARAELENALRLDDRCPAALSLLADIAESQGNFTESTDLLGRLVAREPWDKEFQSSHSRAPMPGPKVKTPPVFARVDHLVKTEVRPPKKTEEEDLDFEEIEDNSTDAIPHVATVTLAEIYFQQGLKEQALQIYRQLLARQPDNETVKVRVREIEASIA